MISRTAVLSVLFACTLNVLARPDFLINHEETRRAAGENPSILFTDQRGYLTLNIDSGSPEVIADITNHLQEKTSEECSDANAEICRRWREEGVQLTISYEENGWRQIRWHQTRSLYRLNHTNCFPLGNSSWFGGPEQKNQTWPVQKMKYNHYPMVTNDDDSKGVADPVWFNSKGVTIIVDRGIPLFVSQNSNLGNPYLDQESRHKLCIIAKLAEPYRDRQELILSYKLGYHKNAKEAYLRSVNDVLGKPTGIPDERMIRDPIWSTWALYKTNINERLVRELAGNITKYGFKNSQLEIDDKWETRYGSLEFDEKKFPDINKLVKDLQRDGFRVTVWTHPFVEFDSPLYYELEQKNFLVKNATGTQTRWWNGEAGLIDFTNWEAAKDFERRQRKNLKDTGIDGLKFDAGESQWLPRNSYLTVPESPNEEYPSRHQNEYLRTVAKFGNLTEVRSAYRTQDLPIFLRMFDKATRWGYDNGLKTLVTTLLQMNMVGYQRVLPDMIGGNVYGEDKLSKELFIRWLQANTFMPSLQFSRVPWEFDNDTIEISLKYAEIHRNHSDIIINLLKNSTVSGIPVNPPIWWNDPLDQEAHEIDSEYLLGENILVAPVLEEGVIKRHIYLPAGKWKDMASKPGTIYEGKKWLKDYPAALETLPWFVRVKSSAANILSSTLLLVASVVFARFGLQL